MVATVMVIDDSMSVRKQVARTLHDAGFAVLEAVDGIDALQQLDAKPDVALLVCDIHMPRMGGLEMLGKMREQVTHAHIPTLMLTTEGHVELVQQAKALGAKGWMVKPLDEALLVTAVQRLTKAAA